MTNPSFTIASALLWGQQQLVDSDSPALDVRVLLCFALEKSDSYLFTWPERSLTEIQQTAFEGMIARRQQGEPIAHIVQQREFWSLPLMVSPATLIPRPDTEVLVEHALKLAANHPMLVQAGALDLGTGTGAIALALASEWPNVSIIGVDIQADAVALAQLVEPFWVGEIRDLAGTEGFLGPILEPDQLLVDVDVAKAGGQAERPLEDRAQRW